VSSIFILMHQQFLICNAKRVNSSFTITLKTKTKVMDSKNPGGTYGEGKIRT
jgi:hypothetical protein